MAVIVDSSPLISITKIGRLDLLQQLYEKVLVPQAVYHEVIVEGKRLHKIGTETIENALHSGWIEVVSLNKSQLIRAEKYRTSSQIGEGEAETISLAVSRKLPIIIDDKLAREMANILDLQFKGSAAVLLEAYLKPVITYKEYLKSLEDLGKVMWLSPELITRLVQLAEEAE